MRIPRITGAPTDMDISRYFRRFSTCAINRAVATGFAFFACTFSPLLFGEEPIDLTKLNDPGESFQIYSRWKTLPENVRKREIEKIAAFISSTTNVELKCRCVVLLGQAKDLNAEGALISILHDWLSKDTQNALVAEVAVSVLPKIAMTDKLADDLLLVVLSEKSSGHPIRGTAIDALGQLGGPGLAALKKLSEQNTKLSKSALYSDRIRNSMACAGDLEILSELLKKLVAKISNHLPEERASAIRILCAAVAPSIDPMDARNLTSSIPMSFKLQVRDTLLDNLPDADVNLSLEMLRAIYAVYAVEQKYIADKLRPISEDKNPAIAVGAKQILSSIAPATISIPFEPGSLNSQGTTPSHDDSVEAGDSELKVLLITVRDESDPLKFSEACRRANSILEKLVSPSDKRLKLFPNLLTYKLIGELDTEAFLKMGNEFRVQSTLGLHAIGRLNRDRERIIRALRDRVALYDKVSQLCVTRALVDLCCVDVPSAENSPAK